MARGRIVILTHQHQGLNPGNGLAVIAFGIWQRQGWEVVVQQGLRDPPRADVAVLHVDLTVVPEPYLELAARYRVCLNGRVRDISKRVVSRDLLARDAPYDGPVMVKTDRNHVGLPERRLALVEGGARARMLDALLARLPRRLTGRLPDDRYLPCPSLAAVPRWVWRHRGLVVERFLTERLGDLYTLNQWHFLGSGSVVKTFFAPGPVVKWADQVASRPLHDEVPEEIRRRRDELQFDYGKFDYLVTPEGPRLLDANKTPWNAVPPEDPRMVIMAGGLEAFLR
jgi:hypothetical protein